jgi:alkanesulfonate monooxygenase SsuD/methylene tetrahydromethanopterin reductase-like flavin-dependent oxidoreductase (luciferase family)
MAAMTAMTLQYLSGGRFLCGLGVSGPQVIEGWHGVRFGKPMTRTKEYIAIIKQILDRQGPLQFKGEEYEIPYAGQDATGLGKPLRSITHGDPTLKFYLASITPAGLRTAGECADGVLPIFYSPEQPNIVSDPILAGKKKAGRPETLDGFDVAPYVRVKVGPSAAACRDLIRPELALYIGGMGARAKNYYNDVVSRAKRKRSRTCISTARRTKPRRRFPTSWSMRSRCAGRPSASATAWPHGSRRPKPAISGQWC